MIIIHEKKKQVAWNKGLTKETDVRLRESGSKISAARQRKKYAAWNKGLTKETDSRMSVCTEQAKGKRVYKKGLTPWNKGKTKETDPKIAEIASKISKTMKEAFASGRLKANPEIGKGFGKSGFRKDLGHFVRSSWEANISRLFKFLDIAYIYEAKVFVFSNDDTYRPDFYLPGLNAYVEIKGHWFEDAIQKLLSFVKEYPDITLDVIEGPEYRRLQRKFAQYIKEWEY